MHCVPSRAGWTGQVASTAVLEVLAEMRETLTSGDTQARRALLGKVVASVEMGKDRGKVSFTFPLACAGLWAVPPEEYEQQDRTVLYRSSYRDSDANTCSHSLAAIQISGRAAITRISSSA
jgi:hypothetical protein